MADGGVATLPRTEAPGGTSLKRFARRRSTIAFLMTLPLIAVIGGLVIWPAGYAMHLATLNRRMNTFIGLMSPCRAASRASRNSSTNARHGTHHGSNALHV